jgi:hypothetical protein
MKIEPDNVMKAAHTPTTHNVTDTTRHEIQDAFQNLHLTFTSQELDMAHFEIERYKQQIQSYQRHIDIMEKDLKKKNSDLSKVKMDCSLANAEKDVLKKEIVSLRECNAPIQDYFYQFSIEPGDDSKLVKTINTPMNKGGNEDYWNNCDSLYRGIEKELMELSFVLEEKRKRHTIHSAISNGLKQLFNRCIWLCSSRKTFKTRKVHSARWRPKVPWHQTRFQYERMYDDCDSMTVLSDDVNPFDKLKVTQKSTILRDLISGFHNFDKNQRRYIHSLQDCVGVQKRTISGLQNEIARLVSLHMSHSFPVSFTEDNDDFYNYEVMLNGEEKMEQSSF